MPSRPKRSGLTLVEVMVGMFVVGTTSLAALSGLLFSFRVSDANLCALAAHAMAVSVSEEIQALGYGGLDPVTLPVDVPSGTTGSLTVNTWNDRTEDIHNTPSNTNDDLEVSIRPEITTGTSSDGIKMAQVIVRYRWIEKSFFSPRPREESLTFVMTDSSAF